MKIALIGPAWPYRGGIAHHTNLLAKALRAAGHDVDVITFRRQYPSWLYPGKVQEETGPGEAGERLLDSMNPLTWLSTARTLRSRRYDLYVFRFWIPLFGPMFGTVARGLGGGKAGGRVLAILDNLIPHERRPGDEAFTDYFFRYCNIAITQSSVVHEQFTTRYPRIPSVMLPHPTYEQFGERLPVEEARRRLGLPLDRKLILFFGFVRKYKGLDLLLQAMPAIVRRRPDVELLVVGEFFENVEEYHSIVRSGKMEGAVHFYDRYVPNEEVASWFSAADLLVLPYRSATNSGIVQIGYNFAMPAVVTDVGSLAEVVVDGKTGFVIPDAEPETIAEAVDKAFEGNRLERFSEGILQERARYSWSAFADGLETFVEETIGTSAM